MAKKGMTYITEWCSHIESGKEPLPKHTNPFTLAKSITEPLSSEDRDRYILKINNMYMSECRRTGAWKEIERISTENLLIGKNVSSDADLAFAYAMKSRSSMRLNNIEQSYEETNRAFEVLGEENIPEECLGMMYSNILSYYREKSFEEKTMKYVEPVEVIYEKAKNMTDAGALSIVLPSYISFYNGAQMRSVDDDLRMDKIEHAIEFAKSILHLDIPYKEKHNLLYSSSSAYINLGKYEEAKEWARIGLEEARANRDKICEMYHTNNLMWAAWESGDSEEAIELGKYILPVVERVNHPWRVYIAENLAFGNLSRGIEQLNEIVTNLPGSFLGFEIKRSIKDDWNKIDKRMNTLLDENK
ncbi:MAG: hypothetical protein KAR20_22405 [Candidatus Heimdallarchaeota archaeon]|nr:hypothetical protein [Candidatus Heimdallarchaeota archaeon]